MRARFHSVQRCTPKPTRCAETAFISQHPRRKYLGKHPGEQFACLLTCSRFPELRPDARMLSDILVKLLYTAADCFSSSNPSSPTAGDCSGCGVGAGSGATRGALPGSSSGNVSYQNVRNGSGYFIQNVSPEATPGCASACGVVHNATQSRWRWREESMGALLTMEHPKP